MNIAPLSQNRELLMAESKGNILVVDDIISNLELVQHILSQEGYTVRTAKNGGEALAVVSEGHPDLILLDIEMPGMKGYDVCSILKADEKTKGIPVIF
ncbi:MAG: response regulator, partial [Anaerolineae bacterium]|nr:response regulator [Anaerolineae bacterium]